MTLTVTFEIVVKDERKFNFDIEQESVFTVEGKDFEDVNRQIDECTRSFIAYNNELKEDDIKILKFI